MLWFAKNPTVSSFRVENENGFKPRFSFSSHLFSHPFIMCLILVVLLLAAVAQVQCACLTYQSLQELDDSYPLISDSPSTVSLNMDSLNTDSLNTESPNTDSIITQRSDRKSCPSQPLAPLKPSPPFQEGWPIQGEGLWEHYLQRPPSQHRGTGICPEDPIEHDQEGNELPPHGQNYPFLLCGSKEIHADRDDNLAGLDYGMHSAVIN